MSQWITLAGSKIIKLVPISYLGTGSDYCDLEFEVPVAEETDCLALITDGTDGGWINKVRTIGWNSQANTFSAKGISIVKAHNGVAEVWRIRAQTNSPAGASTWDEIGAMLFDYGPGTVRNLEVFEP